MCKVGNRVKIASEDLELLEDLVMYLVDLFKHYSTEENQDDEFETKEGTIYKYDGSDVIDEYENYPEDEYSLSELCNIEVKLVKRKKMSIQEVENELGYKIKIVDKWCIRGFEVVDSSKIID